MRWFFGKEEIEREIIAHEIFHSVNQVKFLDIIIKLDIIKAYDKVKWDFLIKGLSKIGFFYKMVQIDSLIPKDS